MDFVNVTLTQERDRNHKPKEAPLPLLCVSMIFFEEPKNYDHQNSQKPPISRSMEYNCLNIVCTTIQCHYFQAFGVVVGDTIGCSGRVLEREREQTKIVKSVPFRPVCSIPVLKQTTKVRGMFRLKYRVVWVCSGCTEMFRSVLAIFQHDLAISGCHREGCSKPNKKNEHKREGGLGCFNAG